jgi:uncharacterized protein with PIN domain
MKQAQFRFYAELNDFLPPGKRHTCFSHSFNGEQSVKHLIESIGIPHSEVDLVLADGRSVDFSHHVSDGERISVYPVFEAFDIAEVTRVRPRPLRDTRFVLDRHLGRLAAYLRMLGFDTLYRSDYADDELVRIAAGERRILLTMDRELLKRREITHGYYVRQSNPRAQVVEVLNRFDLARSLSPLDRCLRCNERLELVPKEMVLERVPARSLQYYNEFRQCPGCQRVYWSGSHYRRMQRFIEYVLQAARSPISEDEFPNPPS